jgi:hypothetical protein
MTTKFQNKMPKNIQPVKCARKRGNFSAVFVFLTATGSGATTFIFFVCARPISFYRLLFSKKMHLSGDRNTLCFRFLKRGRTHEGACTYMFMYLLCPRRINSFEFITPILLIVLLAFDS